MTPALRHASLLVTCLLPLAAAGAAPAEKVTFERHVRPILKAYCLDCHGGGEKPKGKLDLRLRRLIVQGGRSGPAVIAHQPGKSPLVERLRSGEMPPTEKKVPAEQIRVIERWVAGGALTLGPEPETLPPGIDITPEERAYWLYQPLRRPSPPPADGVR